MKNFSDTRKNTDWKSIIFYGFIIVYVTSILFLGYTLNIWEDESYSLHTSSNNLSTVISQSYNFEGQPPFYFVMLALWRHINSNIFFARLLSLIFLGLGAVYFFRLVRLISGSESPKWILVCYLLNPFYVWAGLEIRLYSFVIFLSTVLLYYFLLYYVSNKKKYLYIFLILSLIGLYTQYFFVFEITGLALSVLYFKGWKSFFTLCLYLLPVIILFIPNLFFVGNQVKMIQLQVANDNKFLTVLHSPQGIALGLELVSIPVIINRIVKVTLISLALFSYFKLYKNRQVSSSDFFRKIDIILITLGITMLLFLILIPAMNISFSPRYLSITLPMFLLILTLFKEYSLKIRRLIFTGISIFYISLLFIRYSVPIKYYDFKSGSSFLNKVQYQHEPILLYNKLLLPPFSYYYHKPDSLIALPAYKFDNFYYDDNIYDTSELKNAIKKIYTPTKSYLLMTGKIAGFKYPVKMSPEMIDECLKANYKVTLDTSIAGSETKYALRIRRLEIKD